MAEQSPESVLERDSHPFFWYVCVLVAASAVSVLGFLYGALHDPSSDGGRGGCIAAMIAFFALFVRSHRVFQAFKNFAILLPEAYRKADTIIREFEGANLSEPAVTQPPEEQQAAVLGIIAMMQQQSRDQLGQNLCVFAAGGVGTISWGFGDVAACLIKKYWLTAIWAHAPWLCHMLSFKFCK